MHRAGIPTAPCTPMDSPAASYVGWQPPVVLKPLRQVRALGLQFVDRVSDWSNALGEAFRHDSQVLLG